MNLTELLTKNRSYRRYDESYTIDLTTLKELVALTRLTASARNLQPLRYLLVNTKENNQKVFSTLAWAGYLKDWDGPEEGERPSAYIILLKEADYEGKYAIDEGIILQTLLLGAVEKGLGGCIIGAVNRKKMHELLHISTQWEIADVLALGKPVEQIQLVEMENNNYQYYRDKNQVHYVPKRKLEELIISSL